MVYEDLGAFVKKALNRKKQYFVYSQHKKYIRICCGFDIETTRMEKHAFMYHWQLSWNDDDLLLRKWCDFELFIQKLNEWLEPKNANIIIWVANLGHEFSFLCRRFEWKHIFARESHNPLIATTGRVEFRECLSISGQGGLANLAKNYCKTKKLIGDLDYNKPRNSLTPLTDNENGRGEKQYCINDVRILSEWAKYIFEEFSDHGHDIPLTSTSIVRGDIKQAAQDTGHYEQIKQAVLSLFPKRATYNFIMQFLFRGGYTHANIWYTLVKWDNTIGVDFTSSYPAVMLHEYYPMSPFNEFDCEYNEKEITDESLTKYCTIVYCQFENIEQTSYHAIESQHKIIAMENAKFDNGRLIKADKIEVVLTELDYDIYKKFYKWEKIKVLRALRAVRGRLPNYVLKPLKSYYETKQRLKKEGKTHTNEYKNAKARLNSFYGCMVTRLNFTEYKYNQQIGDWEQVETSKTYSQMIEKQILSPYWGIYVTAHARHRLLETVYTMDSDKLSNNVIYCDTDSIYFDDTPENRNIIKEFNKRIAEYNKQFPAVYADIGLYDWVDKDKDGNPITYEFETLGAKRYIKYYNNHAEITVAGMRKGTFERKIMRQFATDNSYPIFDIYLDENGEEKKKRMGYVDKNELFEMFTDNLILSCDESNKLCSIYDTNPYLRGIDEENPIDEYKAIVKDEFGNIEEMHEKSGVALVPITFGITMEQIYLQLLEQVMDERRFPIWR